MNRSSLLNLHVLALAGLLVVAIGCGGSKSLSTKGPHESFELGKAAYDKGKYLKAIELLQAVVYNYPGDPVVDTAQYYLALSYFGDKQYELAEVEFNRLVINYPSSVYFEHALFMKAVASYQASPGHYGLDQTDVHESIKQFEDFIIDNPESELLPDVRRYLLTARTRLARKYYEGGIVYRRMQAYEAAAIYFQKVTDDYTDTEYGPKATFQLADMDFQLRRFDAARKRFEDFQTVFPIHAWVPKARERAIEAAFRGAEAAFKKGDYAAAREKLQAFQSDYPGNGRSKKAEKYLEEISRLSQPKSQSYEADS
ncbi:MAG TPA: outer membrane protein assembly factor BamD [Candidatus Deferrimicrobium sp.]|nr:outer membrane protein assembly factor BamD [Candidatus Deferrimicrobium sp.]